MRLFLNGLAASAGGGLTYLRNVVPQLSARTDVETTLAVPPALRKELGERPNISFVDLEIPGGAIGRFWREQTQLPEIIRRSGAEVLISAGNFALRKSPIPQILLSRNSLYTSSLFFSDLIRRREYALWRDERLKAILAKRSIYWADRTVAPSHAFADELHRWTGKDVMAIYHGFDRDAFFGGDMALPPAVRKNLQCEPGTLRLLFVSNFTYYRNFETLLRAIPVLRDRLKPREVRLFLTCALSPGANPGAYRTEATADLIGQLGIRDEVVELGSVPYFSLHHLYRGCDIYATAAYAETFAHPLVEAMSSGLPIVASDLPVHREICGEAALYFPALAPDELASRLAELASSAELANRLAANGEQRSLEFCWSKHVDQILALAATLTRGNMSAPGRE
jgi:glycosyltransferase involved in cell wall biosynthesis